MGESVCLKPLFYSSFLCRNVCGNLNMAHTHNINDNLTADNYDKSQFEAELKDDEPAKIHNHFEHLKKIGRAIVYEDGEGDHCI